MLVASLFPFIEVPVFEYFPCFGSDMLGEGEMGWDGLPKFRDSNLEMISRLASTFIPKSTRSAGR
jgi:hypothetical protein